MADRLTRRELVARGAALAALAAFGPAFRFASESGDPRLRALARVVRGPVIVRGQSLYNTVRLPYDANYNSVLPLAIVQPLDAADVSQVVRWAQQTGVHIVARSGGHSYAGYSTTTGVIVDLS